jgi:hypothetical protein
VGHGKPPVTQGLHSQQCPEKPIQQRPPRQRLSSNAHVTRNDSQTPEPAVRFVADQLSIANPGDLMTLYGSSAGRWRHGGRIRQRYGYRTFTAFGVTFRLNHILHNLNEMAMLP